MREYSIREFRMKLKEAFEAAESGDVYITRKGQRYRLCVESTSDMLNRLADEYTEADRQVYGVPSYEATAQPHGVPEKEPTPEIPETPKAAVQRQVEEIIVPQQQAAGLPCCNQASPCKHWRWDAQLAMWQNILTGEIREAQ